MRSAAPILCLLIIGTLAPLGHAQPSNDGDPSAGPRRRYVPFPIDPDFEARLKDRLQLEKQLGPLKNFVKQIAADPTNLKLDPAQLKELQLDDPQFKRLIQEWAQRDPNLKQALQEWVKRSATEKQPMEVRDLQKNLQSILEQPPPAVAPSKAQHPLPPPSVEDSTRAREEELAKATERVMKNAENTKLGDWLRESPAWQRAFQDLRSSLQKRDVGKGDWQRWTSQLRLPEQTAWQLGEQTLDRLRDLPRPNMDGWNPDLSLPAVGQLPTPNIAGPSLPGVDRPSLPSMSLSVTWLLFALLFVLVAWQMVRWHRRAVARDDDWAALGPWPIRPEAVSTRAELVQAFDYLALRTLGLRVKCWNHQAVAQRWSERVPMCASSAASLALLYEQARYTEGAEQLSEPQREAARRSLHQLAEAF